MIIKGCVCVWGGGAWKGVTAWIKTVGVRGRWGGPVTPDLHPPGPFRAAQWLTPVSFQCWHYYYLHQSVGETERGQRCCEAERTSLMPTTPLSLFTGAFHCSPFTPRLPASSSLIVSDKSKHLGGRRGSTSRCVYILWLMICSLGHVGLGWNGAMATSDISFHNSPPADAIKNTFNLINSRSSPKQSSISSCWGDLCDLLLWSQEDKKNIFLFILPLLCIGMVGRVTGSMGGRLGVTWIPSFFTGGEKAQLTKDKKWTVNTLNKAQQT